MTKPKQFNAVSIVPDARGCCEAVRQLVNKRFLGDEAPLLPLDECSQPGECHCVYKKWSDRRDEGDRRTGYKGLASQFHVATDRRDGKDRRRR
jgi:hypothetical protein